MVAVAVAILQLEALFPMVALFITFEGLGLYDHITQQFVTTPKPISK